MPRTRAAPSRGEVTFFDLSGRERAGDRGERGLGLTQLAGRGLPQFGRAEQLLQAVAEVPRPVRPVRLEAGPARGLVSVERGLCVPYGALRW